MPILNYKDGLFVMLVCLKYAVKLVWEDGTAPEEIVWYDGKAVFFFFLRVD